MPRIYVASLSDYNNGHLHGEWIDANQDTDEIRQGIAEMLAASKYPTPGITAVLRDGSIVPAAEEWAIHDYDGFAGIKLSEHEDIDNIVALAELIEDHGEELVEVASEHTSETTADALRSAIEDDYAGTYDSEADYAEEVMSDCHDMSGIPDFIRNHIDWEGIARDMRLGGDVDFIRKGGSVYVFRNH